MFTVGRLYTNCYVVACDQTKEAIIIDPGFENRFESSKIFNFVAENGLTLKLLVNTHGHPDHVCGNEMVKEKFHVPILIHESDSYMLGGLNRRESEFFGPTEFSPSANILLHEGDLVEFGRITLKVVHTPGHTSGSISLLGEREVFTGDTLFAGSIGRTDLPGGSENDMRLSLKRLASLPDHLTVYPGHGPATTMGEERLNNPFL
jgi:glyoxylase-like metal-dependent hydrolase (beta-lactamase superfamily II)